MSKVLSKKNGSTPLLSVVVPVYNVALYLDECLDSLLHQGFSDSEMEVLMVNDGSTDGSDLIAYRWSKRYSNFHLINRKNGGLSAARNTGLDRAKGEYIIFLDSDDVIPDLAYRRMYDIISKTGSDLITGAVYRFHNDVEKSWPFARSIDLFNKTRRAINLRNNPSYVRDFLPCNKMYKREFFVNSGVRYPEGRIYEDIATTPVLYTKAATFDVYSGPVYLWRVTPGSITQTVHPRKATDRLLSLEESYGFLKTYNLPSKVINEFEFAVADYNLRWVFLDLWQYDKDSQKEIIARSCSLLSGVDKDIIMRVPQPIQGWALLARDNKQDELIDILKSRQRSFEHPVGLPFYRKLHADAIRYKDAAKGRLRRIYRVWSRRVRKLMIFYIIRPIICAAPVDSRMGVFSSYWGNNFSTGSGPASVCIELSKVDPTFKSIVFASRRKYETIKDSVDKLKGEDSYVKVVRNESLLYYYYMWRAKYFVNDVNFQFTIKIAGKYHTGKRREQIEIQTTHGVPLKTMGFDNKGLVGIDERDSFLARSSRYDYLVSTSPEIARIFAESHRVKPVTLKTGLPQNDFLFDSLSKNKLDSIKRKYGLSLDKKIILYAPTWRNRQHMNFPYLIDFSKLYEEFGEQYQFVVKIHPFNVTDLKRIDFLDYTDYGQESEDAFIKLLGEVRDVNGDRLSVESDMNEMMLVADILITDYSSAMFSYCHLNKPMIFFTPDIIHYNSNRGTYFDIDEIAPGAVTKNTDDIIKSITVSEDADSWSRLYQDKIRAFKQKFVRWEKGNASRKILEEVGVLARDDSN